MAKKEEKKASIVLERTYNIPLRKQFMKAPRWKRTNRAVKALQAFLVRHMKSDNIKLGKYLNLAVWKHGAKNPPHHVKVEVKKDSDGVVSAEIVGAPKEKPKEELKKKVAKKEDKKDTKPDTKEEKLEAKTEEVKEDKQEKAKEIEKKELKELKKEQPKVQAPKVAPQPKTVEQRPTAPMQKG